MDGTILCYRDPAAAATRAASCKKAWAYRRSPGVNPGGGGPSADLGGSSNYSGENLEGRSGKWF